jgi:hypothetical protein
MSALTDFLNETIKPLCNSFFNAHAHEFDLTHKDGCGLYMEDLVEFLRDQGYAKVGHLKKYGSATQYNGHAVDAFLYRQGDPLLYRAVDVIGNAESTDPNKPPVASFGIDAPRYEDKDWMAEPASAPVDDMVPWVGYDENGFNELKRQLAYDYARRPQGADFDVSVWAARVFHSAYMGPEKKPLGLVAAVDRHQVEWCAALGVSVKDVPADWNIGDPV